MSIPDLSNVSLTELFSLRERTAVVTGGASGIGLAIAKRYAEAGANVAIADTNRTLAMESAARICEQYGMKALVVQCDVSSRAQVLRMLDEVLTEFGRLDVLVNNAGIYPVTPLLDLSESEWNRVLDVNLTGTFLCSQEAARRMVETGTRGVIVNIASTAGYKVHTLGCAHYASSKNGVRALTKALSAELFERFGIRALGIAPRTIETPGIGSVRNNADIRIRERFARTRPIGRDGLPDDIARVALFCASDMSMIMTGSTLLADGGEFYLST